ncbi:MAG: hydantoinase B/oxoprolinase family protein [Candidatus Sedimenticola sp. (ex Thyasira tokunagai)]
MNDCLVGHRQVPPYGVAGGEPGEVGVNYVEHSDGRKTPPDARGQVEMAPGDLFVIETPGGGGYGVPPERSLEPQ